ncbi:MAG: hypothetical protein HQK72_02085 [Desulfamplus sp.]|nr:hypothetical protein [Desulfamplus sp.]
MGTMITIRKLDEFAIEWINQKAKLQGVDLEDIIVQLIYEKVRSSEIKKELIEYNDLDSLAGTWSKKEFDDFFETTDKFNQVDESLWK